MNLLKNVIFFHFFLLEDHEQGALQKELAIAPSEERFKTTSLRKAKPINLISAYSNLINH